MGLPPYKIISLRAATPTPALRPASGGIPNSLRDTNLVSHANDSAHIMIIMRVSRVLLMNFVLTMHGVPLARRISRRYCVAILPMMAIVIVISTPMVMAGAVVVLIVVVISRLINSYISAWDYGDRAVVMVVDFTPSNEG